MPEEHAEPNDRSAARSLMRLWPYVKPVRARLSGAILIAVVASCLGLVIPLVLKWMVDGPVADGDPGGVWLGALYLLLLGIAEAFLFGLRRWVVARPLAGVEASMRAASTAICNACRSPSTTAGRRASCCRAGPPT